MTLNDILTNWKKTHGKKSRNGDDPYIPYEKREQLFCELLKILKDDHGFTRADITKEFVEQVVEATVFTHLTGSIKEFAFQRAKMELRRAKWRILGTEKELEWIQQSDARDLAQKLEKKK